jgi:RNA polymerase sigma factor (sigma-70 family)
MLTWKTASIPEHAGEYDEVPPSRDVVMDSESTGDLFRGAADGDAAAWEALVRKLSPLVWSVARAHGLLDADSQEVYQTSWFRLAQSMDRIREPDRVGAWLASTARHECLKILRSAGRVTPTGDPSSFDRVADELTPEDLVIESEEEAARADRAKELWRAFQDLGESCRRLLRVLMANPQPSYAEAAAALGIAIGSIGPIRQRCLRRLRALLAERGVR